MPRPKQRSASPYRSRSDAARCTDADLAAVKSAGFADGAVIEIVLHVALNTLTNYINLVAGTDIDFPQVEALKAA